MRVVKVSEATGSVLDWMVAKCMGFSYEAYESSRKKWKDGTYRPAHWMPSTDWAQGGPIIEREQIAAWFHTDYGCWCAAGIDWMNADVLSDTFMEMPDASRGPTPLIAAMRCYVSSKLGDEVEVPDGLTS